MAESPDLEPRRPTCTLWRVKTKRPPEESSKVPAKPGLAATGAHGHSKRASRMWLSRLDRLTIASNRPGRTPFEMARSGPAFAAAMSTVRRHAGRIPAR